MKPKIIFIPFNGYELEVQLLYDVIATHDPSEGKFDIRLKGYTYLGMYFEGEVVDIPLTASGRLHLDQLILSRKRELENECYVWELLT